MTEWEPLKPITKSSPWLKASMEEEKPQWKQQEEAWRREQEEWKRQRERQRRREDIREDSIRVFLEEETGFAFDLSSRISTQELYDIYCAWCQSEKVPPEGLRALSWRLKHSSKCYPVKETMLTRNGRRCRGFVGIRAVTDNTDNTEKGGV